MTALNEQLREGLKNLLDSDEYLRYLRTMSLFPSYSNRNVMMILLQNPNVTRVASYSAWQKMGRQVQKGEKGLKIYIPIHRRQTPARDDQTDHETVEMPEGGTRGRGLRDTEDTTPVTFGIGHVFDISQTEGMPLPQIVYELTGDVKNFEAFKKAVQAASPVPIHMGCDKKGVEGYFSPITQEIHIREGMSEESTISTMVHETAHAILHNAQSDGSKKPKEIKELEAESTAFVVLSHFGIDSSPESLGYIAMYNGQDTLKALNSSLTIINHAAAHIIKEMEKTLAVEKQKELEALDKAFSEDMFKMIAESGGAISSEKEAKLLFGEQNGFAIYPCDIEAPFCFRSSDEIERHNAKIVREHYGKPYVELSDKKDVSFPNDAQELENIYLRFNADNRPNGQYMHSLSVSDLVVLSHGDEKRAYYVDSIGFTEMPEVLPLLCENPHRTMEKQTCRCADRVIQSVGDESGSRVGIFNGEGEQLASEFVEDLSPAKALEDTVLGLKEGPLAEDSQEVKDLYGAVTKDSPVVPVSNQVFEERRALLYERPKRDIKVAVQTERQTKEAPSETETPKMRERRPLRRVPHKRDR